METAVVYPSPYLPGTASPSIEPTADVEWALFDSRIDMLNLEPCATTAFGKTSNNRDVRASLHLATAPASSCVQFYTDDKVFTEPSLVAADADLLLIHMAVGVKGSPFVKPVQNFFVYNPHPDWPWMKLLPAPSDWWACSEQTGIARLGKGYVVANLKVDRAVDNTTMKEFEVGMLRRYRSGSEDWETKQLDMPHDPDKGLVEFEWFTDAVFTLDEYVCWVDYHRGILYCNVFSSDPEIGFIQFPGIEMWCGDRGMPTMYRNVSVCKGHLKFVNVDNGRFHSVDSDDNATVGSGDNASVGSGDNASVGSGDTVSIFSDDSECSEKYYSGCTITTWTLNIPKFEWEIDSTPLQHEELWDLPRYRDSPLPRTVPTFPVFSMQESDVVHFIVNGPKYFDKAWIVTVDMKNRSIRHPELYKNPIKAEDSTVDLSNVFTRNARIGSGLVRYFKYPAGNAVIGL